MKKQILMLASLLGLLPCISATEPCTNRVLPAHISIKDPNGVVIGTVSCCTSPPSSGYTKVSLNDPDDTLAALLNPALPLYHQSAIHHWYSGTEGLGRELTEITINPRTHKNFASPTWKQRTPSLLVAGMGSLALVTGIVLLALYIKLKLNERKKQTAALKTRSAYTPRSNRQLFRQAVHDVRSKHPKWFIPALIGAVALGGLAGAATAQARLSHRVNRIIGLLKNRDPNIFKNHLNE